MLSKSSSERVCTSGVASVERRVSDSRRALPWSLSDDELIVRRVSGVASGIFFAS